MSRSALLGARMSKRARTSWNCGAVDEINLLTILECHFTPLTLFRRLDIRCATTRLSSPKSGPLAKNNWGTPRCGPSVRSTRQILDRRAAVGDLHRSFVLRRVDDVQRNAQRVCDGRPDVAGQKSFAVDGDALFVGAADDLASLQSAASHHDRPALRPVVAADVR